MDPVCLTRIVFSSVTHDLLSFTQTREPMHRILMNSTTRKDPRTRNIGTIAADTMTRERVDVVMHAIPSVNSKTAHPVSVHMESVSASDAPKEPSGNSLVRGGWHVHPHG